MSPRNPPVRSEVMPFPSATSTVIKSQMNSEILIESIIRKEHATMLLTTVFFSVPPSRGYENKNPTIVVQTYFLIFFSASWTENTAKAGLREVTSAMQRGRKSMLLSGFIQDIMTSNV